MFAKLIPKLNKITAILSIALAALHSKIYTTEPFLGPEKGSSGTNQEKSDNRTSKDQLEEGNNSLKKKESTKLLAHKQQTIRNRRLRRNQVWC